MEPGGKTTIRSSEGTAEIIVARPTVDTFSSIGLQVETQNPPVKVILSGVVPPLQMYSGYKEVGRLSVTIVTNVGSSFQPQDPSLSLSSSVLDITISNEKGPVSDLIMNDGFMFELQRRDGVSVYQHYILLYNLLIYPLIHCNEQ